MSHDPTSRRRTRDTRRVRRPRPVDASRNRRRRARARAHRQRHHRRHSRPSTQHRSPRRLPGLTHLSHRALVPPCRRVARECIRSDRALGIIVVSRQQRLALTARHPSAPRPEVHRCRFHRFPSSARARASERVLARRDVARDGVMGVTTRAFDRASLGGVSSSSAVVLAREFVKHRAKGRCADATSSARSSRARRRARTARRGTREVAREEKMTTTMTARGDARDERGDARAVWG